MKAIQSPEFYADLQGLAALKRNAKTQSPEALREAAKQFESLFTRMLLKTMRAASMGDSLFDSEQTKFYQDMFDDQMAVHLSRGKGLGLADMLVRQLQQSGAVKGEDTLTPKTLTSALSRTRERGMAAVSSRTASPRPSSGEGQGEGHTNIREKKQAFIAAMVPYAERAARKLGVDPHAIVAQAALERVAVTLDQSLAAHPFQRERPILPGRRTDILQPALDAFVLLMETQRAAPEAAHLRECPQNEEPPHAGRIDETPLLEEALEVRALQPRRGEDQVPVAVELVGVVLRLGARGEEVEELREARRPVGARRQDVPEAAVVVVPVRLGGRLGGGRHGGRQPGDQRGESRHEDGGDLPCPAICVLPHR